MLKSIIGKVLFVGILKLKATHLLIAQEVYFKAFFFGPSTTYKGCIPGKNFEPFFQTLVLHYERSKSSTSWCSSRSNISRLYSHETS